MKKGKQRSNRYYTLMVIPERSSQVKKWLFSMGALRWAMGLGAATALIGIVSMYFTFQFFLRTDEYQVLKAKNHYLESKLHILQNQLNTSDSTIVRMQHFEQKLRMLVQVDQGRALGGIGPLGEDEEAVMLSNSDHMDQHDPYAQIDPGAPREYGFRMKSMELDVDRLGRRASLQEQSLQELYELLKDQETLLASTPSMWPTQGWVTSGFGYRISPFTGTRKMHAGIDIAARVGTQVTSPADGMVKRVARESGYGNLVVLSHGYGIETRYGHNSKILVRNGQSVKRGEVISLVGSTGRSTAPHLHYEVRVNGVPVNPYRYLLN